MRHPGAEAFVPASDDLAVLDAAVHCCKGCDLYERATQAVFGEGPGDARIMLVGEQPGDVEDETGRPFTGPAGRVLDRALGAAGLNREAVYVTNAVKHFRWRATAGTTRRIHQRPTTAQVSACGAWLTSELNAVRPRSVVALGSTAALALFGAHFRLTEHHGVRSDLRPDLADSLAVVPVAMATIHPAAVLRSRQREDLFAELTDDLRAAAKTARRR